MKLNHDDLRGITRVKSKHAYSVGRKLKAIRLENKYTSKDLADFLEVEPQQILRYEKDEQGLSVRKIQKICELFSVDANELLGIMSVCVKDFPEVGTVYQWNVVDGQAVYWLCTKCGETGISYGEESIKQLEERKLSVECEKCNEHYNHFTKGNDG